MSKWGVPTPRSGRPSEHFTWRECACRCCGRIASVEAVIKTCAMMEGVREQIGGPIFVHSFCRCPSYNARVGGVISSEHTRGTAVDFTVRHMTPADVQDYFDDWEGGMGRYVGFTHLDRGPKRRWRG